MSIETPDLPGFWESRYRARRTVWDLGGPSPVLVDWLASRAELPGRALVVGCGRGYDAVALADHGYDVTAVDFAPSALAAASELAGDRPGVRFVLQDLFELGTEFDLAFDLVFEHTCLCAIPPTRRASYAQVVARVLAPGGILLGAFFTGDDPDGPPFGMTPDELRSLFAPHFEIHHLEAVTGTSDPEHLGVLVRR